MSVIVSWLSFEDAIASFAKGIKGLDGCVGVVCVEDVAGLCCTGVGAVGEEFDGFVEESGGEFVCLS